MLILLGNFITKSNWPRSNGCLGIHLTCNGLGLHTAAAVATYRPRPIDDPVLDSYLFLVS